MNTKDILKEGIEQLGENATDETLEKLLSYIDMILKQNQVHNLVNTDKESVIAINHILDSLCVLPFLRQIAKKMNLPIDMLDVGSGAGFPGIPLSLFLSDFDFVLVERMTTRSAFLEECKKHLGLQNVKIATMQLRQIQPKSFDIIIFRAFKPLDKKLLATLKQKLKKNGVIAAMKATRQKIDAEIANLGLEEGQFKIEKLNVPFLSDHERNLVLI